jgi:carboxylesterase type B
MPQWAAFDGSQRPTMVFGPTTKLVDDPGKEERIALKAIRDRQAATAPRPTA